MAPQLNVIVGGEAGQGVQSVGFILAKVLARGGYHIFADQDYESRVRGGHNFYRIRASDIPVAAVREAVDILVALNEETVRLHENELTSQGVIILDSSLTAGGIKNTFSVPMERLALDKAGDKLMANTAAVGACLGLVRFDFNILEQVLREFFKGEVAEKNVKAAKAGYDYACDNYKGGFDTRLNSIPAPRRMLLNGNEAIALGAIAAGCKFMAAYPMTPITSIIEYLAGKAEEFGIVVVPTEDEIAAINMTIGAGYAGVRAMTATSGSGFCLMTEGLGLAAITETPIVIVEGQRPGPAVGLPTRTEQGDLQFVLYAYQGDFLRVVLAPTTIEDCFWMTVKAFNLADKYQTPVILLTDHVLANSYATVNKFDLTKVTIDRGALLPDQETNNTQYQRYKITASGISPRAFPGKGRALVVADADEHDEAGHLIEDAETRVKMVDKRMLKLDGLKKEPNTLEVYGSEKSGTLLTGWGSACGAIREAADILNQSGTSVKSICFNEIWPFPEQAAQILQNAKKIYVIENNATGQFARLIRTETGIKATGNVLKYDGRPFTPAEIVNALKKEGV